MENKERVKKERIKSKILLFFSLFFVFSILFFPFAMAENTPPTLTGGTVTPRRSYPNIDYLYTVTYTDLDNDAPSSVKVSIDEEFYEMKEVDPSDQNYSDGKDYSFKKVMGEGSYAIYYSANDGNGSTVNSDSFTLGVTWDVGHYDIIHFIEEEVFPGIMLILAIVFVILFLLFLMLLLMVLQMRKIAKGFEGKKAGRENEEKKPERE
ncbi:MAG: hypothetical protein JSV09_09340 [Thermoplasmata archaeon]|nr:MAG: hypothetical protein JSV09_09340 [Thermoplasmata archaeon]